MENQKNYTLSIQIFKNKKDIEQFGSMSFLNQATKEYQI